MNNVHFKSGNKEWETPNALFTPLRDEFKIVLDTCATEGNTKCRAWIDRKINSLTSNWVELIANMNAEGAGWMNPPYGRGIDKWVKKAYDEAAKGATIVALLPARTDTSWFHNYIHNKHEVRFLKGRIKFVDAKSSAPFPSMIVIFKAKKDNFIQKLWKKL